MKNFTFGLVREIMTRRKWVALKPFDVTSRCCFVDVC